MCPVYSVTYVPGPYRTAPLPHPPPPLSFHQPDFVG